MKTTNHITRNFPRPGRFSLYMFAVVVLCFFNWVALKAEDPIKKANTSGKLLVIALAEEEEPALHLQDWMLDFENEYLAINEEPEISVEPWMLSFSNEYMAATDEAEISYEPWMINFEQRCLLVDKEQDHQVECWMFSTYTWDCAQLLARR